MQSPRWSVWRLSPDGQLSDLDHSFEMSRSLFGVVAFTPDGEIGLAAQDDGTIGVFRLAPDGTPEVLDPAYQGPFYATSIVMDPSGARAYVLDRQWRDIGGGVYSVRIECDGTLTSEGQLFAARLPAALLWLGDGRAALAADDAMTSAGDRDVHLLSWTDEPGLMASVSLFEDESAIVASAALGADAGWLLLGDGSQFSGVPNRVAVGRVTEGGIEPVQVLSPVEDPFSIVMSPFDGSGIVVSGFGDAIFRLRFDAGSAEPFSVAGELAYAGPPPQLPGSAVMIERGALRGRVLVAENVAIRQVEFPATGGVLDLGPTSAGQGVTAVVGAIGVQP
jgi:hypothetical protein